MLEEKKVLKSTINLLPYKLEKKNKLSNYVENNKTDKIRNQWNREKEYEQWN